MPSLLQEISLTPEFTKNTPEELNCQPAPKLLLRAMWELGKENKKFKPICFLDSNWKKNNTYALKKKIYHISKINRIDFDKIISGFLFSLTVFVTLKLAVARLRLLSSPNNDIA